MQHTNLYWFYIKLKSCICLRFIELFWGYQIVQFLIQRMIVLWTHLFQIFWNLALLKVRELWLEHIRPLQRYKLAFKNVEDGRLNCTVTIEVYLQSSDMGFLIPVVYQQLAILHTIQVASCRLTLSYQARLLLHYYPWIFMTKVEPFFTLALVGSVKRFNKCCFVHLWLGIFIVGNQLGIESEKSNAVVIFLWS